MMAMQLPASKPWINNKALAWTIGVHALLLLLFILLRYTIPTAVVTDAAAGLEVNLGSSETGSGNDQPMNRKKPGPYEASVVYKTVATPANQPLKPITSNEADAPVIDNLKNKKGAEPTQAKDKKHEPAKYSYGPEDGKGGNSANQDKPGTGEGKAGGPGDQGVAGGTPGATNYTGTPGAGGGAIGHTLTGRKIQPDKFEAEFHESGKVVIHVTVDKDGNIIDKRVKSTSGPELTRLALEKLSSAKFSKSAGSEPQQFGDVTFIFKTRQ